MVLRLRCFALVLCAVLASTAFSAGVDDAAAAINEKRFEDAVRLLQPLSDGGLAEAQRMLGELYYAGSGVPQNKSMAFRLTASAAGKDDRIAQFSMGYLFEKGQGVAASQAQAMEYYRKSALQRYVPAMLKLADLLRVSDWGGAKSWYSKAAEYGSEEGREKFSRMSVEQLADARQASESASDARSSACAASCSQRQRYNCENGFQEPSDCRAEEEATSQARASAGATSRLAKMQAGIAESARLAARMTGGPERQADPRAATASAGPVKEVVEPNPYERYGSSPSAWGNAINGWLAVQKNGDSREEACSGAKAAQAAWISADEARGYATASEKTACICGTFSTMGNMSYQKPKWVCGAYHKMTDTRKRKGTLSR